MNYLAALRAQIRTRAEAWATQSGLPHYASIGQAPAILFEPTATGSAHGNFEPGVWAAIHQHPDWKARLAKPHSQKRALPPDKRDGARELDSTNSSDALLMNAFCYPGAAATILKGLGLPAQTRQPEFGYSPMLRLTNGSVDTTEVDMRIGSLLFEAKLTEANFTSRPKPHVFRYSRLTSVFDVHRLPSTDAVFNGYQLIRNVLAADQHNASFVLLVDRRRPDLINEWNLVAAAISDSDLASRCSFRTWQDVAANAPKKLAAFLDAKYGV